MYGVYTAYIRHGVYTPKWLYLPQRERAEEGGGALHVTMRHASRVSWTILMTGLFARHDKIILGTTMTSSASTFVAFVCGTRMSISSLLLAVNLINLTN